MGFMRRRLGLLSLFLSLFSLSLSLSLTHTHTHAQTKHANQGTEPIRNRPPTRNNIIIINTRNNT
jgi:hypothetical protein